MTKRAMGQRRFLEIKARSFVMPFGKYNGKSIDWLLEHDPGYIVWLDDEKIAKVNREIYKLAEEYDGEIQVDWEELTGFHPSDVLDDD